jgi:hypothetical protein
MLMLRCGSNETTGLWRCLVGAFTLGGREFLLLGEIGVKLRSRGVYIKVF